MKKNKITNKIRLELLVQELTVQENTPAATTLKIILINDLINRPLKHVNVISLYYDIIAENEKK